MKTSKTSKRQNVKIHEIWKHEKRQILQNWNIEKRETHEKRQHLKNTNIEKWPRIYETAAAPTSLFFPRTRLAEAARTLEKGFGEQRELREDRVVVM